MSSRRKIAVLVESSRGYGRGLLHGLATYVREHEPWIIHNHERRLYDDAPEWLKHWRGDGIIARIASPQLARQIARLHVPTVDLLGLHPIQGVPIIITDHQAVSRLAADHLLSCGLSHFAFCGFAGIHFSKKRSQYYGDYLASQGRSVSVYTDLPRRRKAKVSMIEGESNLRAEELAAWLKSLPKPVGLMAATDNRGHQVLNVCSEYGIVVPDEIAMIGVDNDEMLCELCDPPLSSVALNPWKVGYEAAALLDKMMRGAAPPSQRTLIPPLGIVVRRSTDVVTIPDADLAAALRLIRQRACQGMEIEDIVQTVKISRSTLKRRFAAFLRRSPQDEIHRVQIERVMQLLSTTKLPLLKIAEQAGFRHVETMCKLFKRRTGLTPGHYRQTWSEAVDPDH
ncbi:MAG: XylR family transcriptional regulator [Pirellulales bacterium]|nr:XylR family transcriptional regulator [Pirellulales bacterium]